MNPHVKRAAADAEAICEAMTRPTMCFVEVKKLDADGRQTLPAAY